MNVYCRFRSPAAGLKQRKALENNEMETETIEVVDAKGRRSMVEAPLEESFVQHEEVEMLED